MLQHLMNAAATASTWYLVAIAFTLIHRVYGLFDISIAAVAPAAAFITVHLVAQDWHPLAGWVAGCGVSAAVLSVSRVVALRGTRTYLAGPGGLLISLGVYTIVVNLLHLIWGPEVRLVTTSGAPMSIGVATLSAVQVSQIVLLLGAVAGTELLLRSRVGLAMQAAARAPRHALLHGVSVDAVHWQALVVAAAACSAAGVSQAVSGGTDAYSGVLVLLYGITTSLLGSASSLRAPIFGIAMMIPAVAWLRWALPSRWADPVLFTLLFCVIVFRGASLVDPYRRAEQGQSA